MAAAEQDRPHVRGRDRRGHAGGVLRRRTPVSALLPGRGRRCPLSGVTLEGTSEMIAQRGDLPKVTKKVSGGASNRTHSPTVAILRYRGKRSTSDVHSSEGSASYTQIQQAASLSAAYTRARF